MSALRASVAPGTSEAVKDGSPEALATLSPRYLGKHDLVLMSFEQLKNEDSFHRAYIAQRTLSASGGRRQGGHGMCRRRAAGHRTAGAQLGARGGPGRRGRAAEDRREGRRRDAPRAREHAPRRRDARGAAQRGLGVCALPRSVHPAQARRRSAELWEDGDAMRQLNGSWRLIYSTSSDVAKLGELPLGFQLGRVYQPINVETHAFENQLMVDHTLRLAAGSLRVVGELVALPPGKKAHTPPNPTPPNPYM